MPTLTAECPKDNVCDDVMGWGVKPSERSESNVAAAVWTDDIRHAHFKATRALRVNSGKKCAIRGAHFGQSASANNTSQLGEPSVYFVGTPDFDRKVRQPVCSTGKQISGRMTQCTGHL